MSSGGGPGFVNLRKLFPTKELASISPAEIAALGKIYTKWQVLALPFVLGYGAGITYGLYLLLRPLGRLAAQSHEPSRFVIVPDPEFWFFPALFLGIIFSAVPTHFTMKALLRDRYEEYNLWTNLHYRFDGWKAFRVLAVIFVIGSALMIAGGLLTWVAFGDKEVRMGRLLPPGTTVYPYSQVKSLAHLSRSRAPNGNIGVTSFYAVRFNDGETWTTPGNLGEADAKRYSDIIALVAERSGQPIQQLDFIEDLKP